MDEETKEELPDLATIGVELLSEKYLTYLSNLGKSELNQMARFFEKTGYLKLSFEISQDFDSKFQIALKISDLALLYALLSNYQAENPQTAASNIRKWRSLGDLALKKWNINIAECCYWMAKDYSTLLLVLTSTNNRELLERLAQAADDCGRYNIAFQAWWSIKNVDKCVNLLAKTGRFSEAAFLARTYGISTDKLQKVTDQWKEQLSTTGKEKIAERLITDFSQLAVGDAPTDSLINLDDEVHVATEDPGVELAA
ncbi:hypothetical protein METBISCDRAFT_28862 [Metschnikowia bicuspidata]|uniref:COPA/B TPR domain-containing protein n=1 Tax=Metschnikowia bicuspidata TaxID=27322 RepID=A0A4P9Z7Q5_9ASCO|nr:hypothetical protein METBISCDRAFT_28862 [Metschnikowia bicuspidata]